MGNVSSENIIPRTEVLYNLCTYRFKNVPRMPQRFYFIISNDISFVFQQFARKKIMSIEKQLINSSTNRKQNAKTN